MKKHLGLFTAPLLILGISGTAIADGGGCCFTPYLGVDAQIRHMSFFKRFGGNLLKENYPQGNFFAGLKFCDYVGIEVGYTMSQKKSRYKTLRSGETIFGTILPIPPASLVSREDSSAYSKIQGWNLNLMGFLPIICEDNSLSLVGGIGVSQLKLKIHHRLKFFAQGSDNLSPIIEAQNLAFEPLKKHKYKGILRLTGGIQQLITDCFGVRGLVTWENTTQLKSRVRRSNGVLFHSKPKNAITYGIGIFTQF